MKIVLCVKCSHHRKEHAKLGCSLTRGMEDFPGSKPSKHDVVTMYYSCECQKFVEDDWGYFVFTDRDMGICHAGREQWEQIYCEQLMAAGLL